MLGEQDFKSVEERKDLAFNLEDNKKSTFRNSIKEDPKNKKDNTNKVKSFISYKDLEEVTDINDITFSKKITNLDEYKKKLEEKNKNAVGINLINNKTIEEDESFEEEEESFDEKEKSIKIEENSFDEEEMSEDDLQSQKAKVLKPKFKTMLSDKKKNFTFTGYISKTDTDRMFAVKEALRTYYSIRDEEFDGEDEEEREAWESGHITRSTTALQALVTNCNRYIANRWPISKMGRQRLKEVKELRKMAISELGVEAGHPGWRLAVEYLKFGLKFGLKLATSPLWVPAKTVYHGGIWAGRVAKRTGRLIQHKWHRFVGGMRDAFGRGHYKYNPWKATFLTAILGISTAVLGTIGNIINTAVMGVCLIPWLPATLFYYYPRYLYHLIIKKDVNLEGNTTKDSERIDRLNSFADHEAFEGAIYGSKLDDGTATSRRTNEKLNKLHDKRNKALREIITMVHSARRNKFAENTNNNVKEVYAADIAEQISDMRKVKSDMQKGIDENDRKIQELERKKEANKVIKEFRQFKKFDKKFEEKEPADDQIKGFLKEINNYKTDISKKEKTCNELAQEEARGEHTLADQLGTTSFQLNSELENMRKILSQMEDTYTKENENLKFQQRLYRDRKAEFEHEKEVYEHEKEEYEREKEEYINDQKAQAEIKNQEIDKEIDEINKQSDDLQKEIDNYDGEIDKVVDKYNVQLAKENKRRNTFGTTLEDKILKKLNIKVSDDFPITDEMIKQINKYRRADYKIHQIAEKEESELEYIGVNGKRKIKSYAFEMPRPHFYHTWYQYFRSVLSRMHDNSMVYVERNGEKVEDYKDRDKDEDENNNNIRMIVNGLRGQRGEKLLGHHFQYRTNFLFGKYWGMMFGPVRDQYYHQTTMRLKGLYNFLRYDNKNDFDQINKRAREDNPMDDDYIDDVDVEEEEKVQNNDDED